jgi:hypothetical protein
LGANRILHETAKTTVVSLSGMIRFGKRVVFLGIEQLFFVRKEISPGTFKPNVHTIRFVGLSFVFASGEGWRTDAGKLGWIRFVRTTCFSQIQMLSFIRRAAD